MVQLAVSVSSFNNESLVMMLLVWHAIARLRLDRLSLSLMVALLVFSKTAKPSHPYGAICVGRHHCL